MPEGAAMWGDVFLILTTISVVYGAFSAVVQTDLKYINAYSSYPTADWCSLPC